MAGEGSCCLCTGSHLLSSKHKAPVNVAALVGDGVQLGSAPYGGCVLEALFLLAEQRRQDELDGAKAPLLPPNFFSFSQSSQDNIASSCITVRYGMRIEQECTAVAGDG